MGARPPADDDGSEPTAIEFGIAAMDAKLAGTDIDYPATADEIRAEIGHVEVPCDPAGHSITVADALETATLTRFESEQELLNTLHPVFERKREETTTTLLTQLRALVPF
jgi:hypothetical protein